MSLIYSLLFLLAIALVAFVIYRSGPTGPLVDLANVGEGRWQSPMRFIFDTSPAREYLLVKKGAAEGSVAIAGVADRPIGYCLDTPDIGYGGAVELLAITKQSAIGVASEALVDGDILVPAANGKVRKLPATAGSYWIVGYAIQAASGDNETVNYIPSAPVLRVVP